MERFEKNPKRSLMAFFKQMYDQLSKVDEIPGYSSGSNSETVTVEKNLFSLLNSLFIAKEAGKQFKSFFVSMKLGFDL